MRKILTPEEREERRKARNRRVVESARTYTGERGGPAQWAAAAGDVVYHTALPATSGQKDPLLALLGLEEVPKTLADLRSARRRAMLSAHADKGGSHAAGVAINAAYEKLRERIRSV